jgi:UDP-N-acetyl-D-mannosaminuronic acid transferase (WecB/TagA/CpsF family)
MSDQLPTRRALGVDFFLGTAAEAVICSGQRGGLVVAPAAPSMVNLQYDPEYRRAILEADLAIADSGFMVLLWRVLRNERVSRISGLAFFRALLNSPDTRVAQSFFWVLPREKSRLRTLEFAGKGGLALTANDCYIAPAYGDPVRDEELLALLERRRPKHIVVGIGGGMQDKLGSYLKNRLRYRPAIYCLGAAPGFLTGDQVPIPIWIDRLLLGWLIRAAAQPRVLIPRLWRALKLPGLILRYGREMPPLKSQK